MSVPLIRYDPIGRCVYCGSTANLTDEHIIPKGLKGNLILPRASCRDCAKITGRVETFCLRHMMGRFRRRVGIKSRKPQPASLALRITKPDGRKEERRVPIPDLPTAISLPMWYDPPLLLMGEGKPFEVAIWSWIKHDAAEAVAKLGGVGFEVAAIQPLIFTRMLAKIAHCHAITQFGLGTFRPLLIEHIRSGLDNPNSLIGGPANHPAAEPFLHRITSNRVSAQGREFILTEVRLLAQLGAPLYFVLVGEA